MRTRTIQTLVVASAALLAAGAASADPIYLKGGQCIQIGSQEVCAMSQDKTDAAKAFHIQHVCRYAMHPGAEIPNLKNHALIQILTAASGTRTETIVRQFGINDSDKVECQKDADRLNAPKP